MSISYTDVSYIDSIFCTIAIPMTVLCMYPSVFKTQKHLKVYLTLPEPNYTPCRGGGDA